MAMQQQKTIKASDIIRTLPDVDIPVTIVTRLAAIEFPWPSESNLVLKFQTFTGEASVKFPQAEKTIHLQGDAQPGLPETDILDDKGDVAVSAGEQQSPIPSVSDVRALKIPDGPVVITTLGELIDLARKAIYLTAIELNPDWSGAVEDK
jgi:hypothetical protein